MFIYPGWQIYAIAKYDRACYYFSMPVVLKTIKWVITVLTVIFLTIYFVRAFNSRNMAELGLEYRIEFENEFDASQEEQTDWAAYLAIESNLAIELEEKIDAEARPDSLVDRFSANSLTDPDNYDSNWNHSYELSAVSPRGVAVLLHGLTDSPYSMLSTAQVLVASGYNVVVPRMPGHGFAIGGLLQARWEDWTAAVRVAVRHAMDRPGGDQSLLLAGYSNGGLLAIDYAIHCDEVADLRCPDGLVLLSPAIAVSPLAVVTNWHNAVSWLPYFEKFAWFSILPEIDPFKFTSFPKRAAWEIYKMSKRLDKLLQKPATVAKLPPILTFQSLVDNTIDERAIVTILYEKLPANGSELVIYDINRNSTHLSLMKTQLSDPANVFEAAAPLRFDVTILRNSNRYSREISVWTLTAGQQSPVTRRTDLQWPPEVYSLSHIGLPFRPDDMVYGDGSFREKNDNRIVFGAMAARGEPGMLRLSSDYFLRMRYNPFFTLQAELLGEWLGKL
jgi:alpha-beta hydrolase superfamily lysophospholipase